jgi:hypothetical protein
MSTLHFAATHSSGRVHLRKSASRAYTHAVVGASFGSQAFCGRLDLALKEHSKFPSMELVEARPITKEEFAKLTKASKQSFAARFMGKRYTTTRDGAAAPYVCAVGFYSAEHTTRHPVNVAATERRIAHARTLEQDAARDERIAVMEQQLVNGYWDQAHSQHISVQFYDTKARAFADIDRHHRAPAFRTAELLSLEV